MIPRSQVVLVDLAKIGEAEWVTVRSAIGEVGDVDVRKAATMLNSYVVGGLVCVDDIMLVREVVPISGLNMEDFEVILLAVMGVADELEAKLTARDEF